MKLTQEQIDAMLAEAVPDVVQSFKEQIKQQVGWDVTQKAREVISNAVTEWVKVNIIPECVKSLEESKNGLIAVGPALAQAVVKQLAESMTHELSVKMKNSWERKKIFEAIWG